MKIYFKYLAILFTMLIIFSGGSLLMSASCDGCINNGHRSGECKTCTNGEKVCIKDQGGEDCSNSSSGEEDSEVD